MQEAVADIISQRALIGWTTHGHTAVDVQLYAFGPGSSAYRGTHDNTFIGKRLARQLTFDLKAITQDLRSAQKDRAAE